MNKTKSKATEVTFDVVKTLSVIGTDEDLKSMYNEKFGTDIKLAIASAKEDLIKAGAKKFIKSIFTEVILKRKSLLDMYVSISDTAVVEDTKKKLPRRYGKMEILKDVEEQGGKPTEIQRMLLKVNDLKNDYAKLNRLGISNMLGGSDSLSDNDCREIIGAINNLENKIKKFVK